MHCYGWGFLYYHLEETGTGRTKLSIVMAGDSDIIIYRGDRNRKKLVMHCYGWGMGFLYYHLEETGTGRTKLCIVMAGDSYIIIYRGDRNRKNRPLLSMVTVNIWRSWSSLLGLGCGCWVGGGDQDVSGMQNYRHLSSNCLISSIRPDIFDAFHASQHLALEMGSWALKWLCRDMLAFFHKLNPPRPLINRLKWFRWKVRFRRDIREISDSALHKVLPA